MPDTLIVRSAGHGEESRMTGTSFDVCLCGVWCVVCGVWCVVGRPTPDYCSWAAPVDAGLVKSSPLEFDGHGQLGDRQF